MKITFFGSDEFAAYNLEKLIVSGTEYDNSFTYLPEAETGLAWAMGEKIHEINPETGGAWTQEQLSLLEAGVTTISGFVGTYIN